MNVVKFRHELTYDASPEAVFDMLADPQFRRGVCEAQGVLSHDIVVTRNEEGFTLVGEQVQSASGLPSFAVKFAGDATRVVVVEEWTGHRAKVRLTAPGKPAWTSGTVHLEARAAGTLEVVELEISVKVPMIGGKLEALMAKNLKDSLAAEQAVGAEWLTRTQR